MPCSFCIQHNGGSCLRLQLICACYQCQNDIFPGKTNGASNSFLHPACAWIWSASLGQSIFNHCSLLGQILPPQHNIPHACALQAQNPRWYLRSISEAGGHPRHPRSGWTWIWGAEYPWPPHPAGEGFSRRSQQLCPSQFIFCLQLPPHPA